MIWSAVFIGYVVLVGFAACLISALNHEVRRADKAAGELAKLKANDARIVDQMLVQARQELKALEDYYERKLKELGRL